MTGPRRASDDFRDLPRLERFRQEHPGVVIGPAEFNAGWDARIPLPRDGEGYFAPRPLGDLLDALEQELDDGPEAQDTG